MDILDSFMQSKNGSKAGNFFGISGDLGDPPKKNVENRRK